MGNKRVETDSSEPFENHYKNSLKIETRLGIILAIKTYGSLNIKILSEMLGKTESTIFHHISEMLKEPKLIEIDLEKTEKNRGKFFKLSEAMISRYKEDYHVFEAEIPEKLRMLDELSNERLSEIFIDQIKNNPGLANEVRMKLKYHSQLANFIVNNAEKTEKAFLSGLIPARKDFPCGTFDLLSIDIKVTSLKHVLQIAKVINDFFRQLYELKRDIEQEMKENNIPEEDMVTEHYFLFGGVIDEFQFRNKN